MSPSNNNNNNGESVDVAVKVLGHKLQTLENDMHEIKNAVKGIADSLRVLSTIQVHQESLVKLEPRIHVLEQAMWMLRGMVALLTFLGFPTLIFIAAKLITMSGIS
jgi:Cu/Ag efflux pump CusA